MTMKLILCIVAFLLGALGMVWEDSKEERK